MKKALITGITGQDGAYLSRLLLEKGYEVHGIVRRVALEDPEHRLWRLRPILNKLVEPSGSFSARGAHPEARRAEGSQEILPRFARQDEGSNRGKNSPTPQLVLHSGSLESYASLFNVVEKVKPDECYHLAAQSFVSYSFEDEFSTINTNINGTHYMLSAIKNKAPKCKFYFAASSEVFGQVREVPQNENTAFHPRSPYGISKVAGFELTRNYREAYNIFACNGILFNHESPMRGYEFVTRKITNGVANIKAGLSKELRLGNLDAKRDWGFARDYCEAMFLMLQQDKPDDYVIATGETHTVREFAEIAFEYAGLNWKDYVKIDESLYRPAEVYELKGDFSKARKKLGWETKVKFENLVKMMVDEDIKRLKLQ